MQVAQNTAAPETGDPRARGERLADWADSRTGLYGLAKVIMRKVFPDHWSFMLGEVCLWSFVVLVLTGIYLTLFFHPSMNEVLYHGRYTPLNGISMSEAYSSTLHISFDIRGGLLVRQLHHWAALIFVAGMFVHMLRHFFTGSFRKPRELNWLFGWTMLVLGMIEGFVGYSLPDDLLSGTGIRFLDGALLSLPVAGTYLSMLLFGGEFPGHDFVSRFYSIHILLLPGLFAVLIVAHLILIVYHKHTQWQRPGHTEKNVVGMPLLPVYMAKAGGFFFLVAGVLTVIAAIATINPIWVYGPYRPDQVSSGAQPDWYMGFAEGLVRVMPGWEINAFGHTLALGVLIPLVVFVMVLLLIGLYPFFEAWVTGDTREHHLLDRPRNRPVRTALGAAWTSLYLCLLAGGGNDVIATHLHLSVNTVTWAVRVGFFLIPAATFTLTQRICLGLQHRDQDLLHHGTETGIIRRLPHGEYIEIHKPLTPQQRHRRSALPLADSTRDPQEHNPPPATAGRTQALRRRLSQALDGPGNHNINPPQEQTRRRPPS